MGTSDLQDIDYRIQQNIRGAKLSRLEQQLHDIRRENFRGRTRSPSLVKYKLLRLSKNRESFPSRLFCRIRYMRARVDISGKSRVRILCDTPSSNTLKFVSREV